MKIVVVGAGYVGLVTAACFAKKGHAVVVVENDQHKIDALKAGRIPFYEPDLDLYVQDGLAKGHMIFVPQLADALTVHAPDIIFSCVGTPSLPNGSVDMSYVWNVMLSIGTNVTKDTVIVNKSTVPVGTARKAQQMINDLLLSRGSTISCSVASNPEFLREGSAILDFMEADRIVCGIETERARELLYSLYTPFVSKPEQIIEMNFESAELTKYAANAMLATRISFINEVARLADAVHADIDQVKRGIGSDPRIGGTFLNAGVGYGGSCFPKDVDALISIGEQYHQTMHLVQQVKRVNEIQKRWFISRVLNHYGNQIFEKTIGIWGLSFKPETDDIRCAPALELINALLEEGAHVIVYDPAAMGNVRDIYKDRIKYVRSAKEVLAVADALVIMTEWKEFTSVNLEVFNKLKDRVVFDGRNCFDPIDMHMNNITYFCVGRNLYTHEDFDFTPKESAEMIQD